MSRKTPRETIDRLIEYLDNMAGEVGADAGRPGLLSDVDVDVIDAGDTYVVRADLPGFTKDEIDVSVREDRLRVRAHREEDVTEHEMDYVRQERLDREVERTVRLPGSVGDDDAEASYSDGVLEVRLPKAKAIGEGERIEIE